MTGNSFAEEWPGQWGRAGKAHRRGRKNWMFAHGEESDPGAWVFAHERGKGRHGRPSEEELEDLIAMRRMRGGPWGGGGGPWGGGGGPWGGGPRGRGRGRARRGDVRLALLRLLAEEPRNGYQLMQTIEERSDGSWRPSPGSVYPVLSQLEDEGLVRATERDGAKLFELTDAGRQYVDDTETETPPWETSEGEDHPFRQLRRLMPEIGRASGHVMQSGNEDQIARAIEILKDTRRKLYGILAEDEDA
jgi:DNA-binding PadR family transcriptional regulator